MNSPVIASVCFVHRTDYFRRHLEADPTYQEQNWHEQWLQGDASTDWDRIDKGIRQFIRLSRGASVPGVTAVVFEAAVLDGVQGDRFFLVRHVDDRLVLWPFVLWGLALASRAVLPWAWWYGVLGVLALIFLFRRGRSWRKWLAIRRNNTRRRQRSLSRCALLCLRCQRLWGHVVAWFREGRWRWYPDRFRRPVFLAVATHNVRDDYPQARHAGAHDVLSHAFTVDELQDRAGDILRRESDIRNTARLTHLAALLLGLASPYAGEFAATWLRSFSADSVSNWDCHVQAGEPSPTSAGTGDGWRECVLCIANYGPTVKKGFEFVLPSDLDIEGLPRKCCHYLESGHTLEIRFFARQARSPHPTTAPSAPPHTILIADVAGTNKEVVVADQWLPARNASKPSLPPTPPKKAMQSGSVP